ncbi:MAG TPA: hypothetical protein P5229_00465 [Candidatus Gracilibacteria bacterium]|nr:hypothetical protein [Candidatus Gracilibacteria bacterium]HRY90805.1 hypothetical protein [Candidatus Gracilibacteria bacterium]
MSDKPQSKGVQQPKELPLNEIKQEAIQLYFEFHLADEMPDDHQKDFVQAKANQEFREWKKDPGFKLRQLKHFFPKQDPHLYLYALEYLVHHINEIHLMAIEAWKKKHKIAAVTAKTTPIRRKVSESVKRAFDIN